MNDELIAGTYTDFSTGKKLIIEAGFTAVLGAWDFKVFYR
jgi:hypothetical protein